MKQDETRLCSPSVRLVIRFSVCMGSPCVILFLFVYLVPVQNTMAQTSKQVRLAAPSILRIRALRPYSPYSGTLCQLMRNLVRPSLREAQVLKSAIKDLVSYCFKLILSCRPRSCRSVTELQCLSNWPSFFQSSSRLMPS